MEVLRRCPLAIAQRLVHCAIALSTAVLDRITKTMSVAPLLTNDLDCIGTYIYINRDSESYMNLGLHVIMGSYVCWSHLAGDCLSR